MGKGKTKASSTKNENKTNIVNFTKESTFFFDITKIYPCIDNIVNKSDFIINENEIKILRKKISDIRTNLISKLIKYKEISILNEFKEHLDKIETCDSTKSKYATRINSIIFEQKNKSNKVIILSKIKNIYSKKYKKEISLSTISRIMRKHLRLNFRRVTFKNSKLNKKNY